MPVAFDTLKLSEELAASGFSEEQARGLSRALREVEDAALKDLATKEDIGLIRSEMKFEFSDVRADIKLVKWMLGVLLAGVVSLVMKTFFTP
jgi:hypothetical protein